MRRVGVREFRDHATQYLKGDEVLAIERHGQPIGFFIPTAASRWQTFSQALSRLDQTVKQILAETGYSEEELSRLFDLSVPESNLPERPRRKRATSIDETGR